MAIEDKETELRQLVAFIDSVTGIYSRVAERLSVSPSYVSRVARRERKSSAVEHALLQEWRKVKAEVVGESAKTVIKRIVFVLDDEPAIAETWRLILSSAGYDPKAFCDPLRALEAIRESPPPVLVTDVALPGISGIDLAITLVEENIPTRVILASGHATTPADLEVAAKKGYLFNVLPKPIGPITLRQRVQELMQEGISSN